MTVTTARQQASKTASKPADTRKPRSTRAKSVAVPVTVTPVTDILGVREGITAAEVETYVLASESAGVTRLDADIRTLVAVKRALASGTLKVEGTGGLIAGLANLYPQVGSRAQIGRLAQVADLALKMGPGLATIESARAAHSALCHGVKGKDLTEHVAAIMEADGKAEDITKGITADRDAAKVAKESATRGASTRKTDAERVGELSRAQAWDIIGQRLASDLPKAGAEFALTPAERVHLSTIAAIVEAMAHRLATTVADLGAENAVPVKVARKSA